MHKRSGTECGTYLHLNIALLSTKTSPKSHQGSEILCPKCGMPWMIHQGGPQFSRGDILLPFSQEVALQRGTEHSHGRLWCCLPGIPAGKLQMEHPQEPAYLQPSYLGGRWDERVIRHSRDIQEDGERWTPRAARRGTDVNQAHENFWSNLSDRLFIP